MFVIQQNKSAECQPCPVETFKSLTQAPETAQKIDEHRRLRACGRIADAKKVKDTLPGCLYQAKEVLESVGTAKYNKGQTGHWRLQSQCVLNGLVMCDFDHVGSEPKKVYENIIAHHDLEELGIVLFFITPGGEGLKSVHKARMEWGNLVDNQKQMAKILGLAIKIDKSCKDSSRLSYIPKWDDILYINEQELFTYDNPLYDENYGKQYREGNSQGTIDFAETAAGEGDQAAVDLDVVEVNLDQNEDGEYCYHGVTYKEILDKWWELKGGKPGQGDRHQRMLELAGELRRIVDNRPQNVFWLMQQTDVYEDLLKEGRKQELVKMCSDVCQYRPRGPMSDELAKALDCFGIKYTKKDTVQNNLPYDDWADRLMQLPLGCYEPDS